MELTEKKLYSELNFYAPAFSAGDYAVDMSASAAVPVCGRFAPKTTQYQKLFLAACHALGVQSGDIVRGVLALPLEWANIDGPELAARFSKEWSINDVKFRARIEHKSEGLLAVLNHALNFDGTLQRAELLENCIVVDVGGGTTDIAQIKNGRVGNRKQSIDGLGINQIAERIRQEFKSRGIMISVARARQVFLEKSYKHRGVDVPGVNDNIIRMIDDLANGVYNAMTDRIRNEWLDESDDIILTGGGGQECLPSLKTLDSRFFCSEYPVYDNALAALKGAMRHKGNYVYIGFDIGNSHTKAVRWMGDHVLAVCFRSIIGERIFEESAR